MNIKLHDYQTQVWLSRKKITVAAAGIQSGKTHIGPVWLWRAICKGGLTGNFILCAPTYKILKQASVPKLLMFLSKYGSYKQQDGEFVVKGEKARIFVRSLDNPESLEGIPDVKAVWLDEGGMITKYAWENVEGRAARLNAPILITTTPYALNWLYFMFKDFQAGKRDDVKFITWKSSDSPYFPKEEYDRQKKLLDPRRFVMKYDGVFGRMEGLVYDKYHVCDERNLPVGTRFFAGVDWGYTDPFAFIVVAMTPDGIHYIIDEFLRPGMTMSQIIDVCKARMKLYNIEMCVCDPSRPDSIEELNRYGVPACKGDNKIEYGIDKVRELINTNKLFTFKHKCPYLLDEFSTYHYPEPKELKTDDKSIDQKPVDANNHAMDAMRYIIVYLNAAVELRRQPKTPGNDYEVPQDVQKRLKWLKKGGSSRNHGY